MVIGLTQFELINTKGAEIPDVVSMPIRILLQRVWAPMRFPKPQAPNNAGIKKIDTTVAFMREKLCTHSAY